MKKFLVINVLVISFFLIVQISSQNQRRARPLGKLAKYVDKKPLPPLTAEQKEKGYLIFQRNYLEMTFPGSIPRSEEIKPKITTFASLGEYEPITFCVRALKNLDQVSITISDLVGPSCPPSRAGNKCIT